MPNDLSNIEKIKILEGLLDSIQGDLEQLSEVIGNIYDDLDMGEQDSFDSIHCAVNHSWYSEDNYNNYVVKDRT